MNEDLIGSGWGGPKGGAFNINAPGQEVLERTSCVLSPGNVELRFTVKLPARGRTIMAQKAEEILNSGLVQLVQECLFYPNLKPTHLTKHIRTVELQDKLRAQLRDRNLVGFIANGSVLPRASGAKSLPMRGKSVVPFASPKTLEVSLEDLDGNPILGMGVSKGVTVLTGGGFHGKSTVLEALQSGVYNHVPEDGRERVVTDPTAVKIRAEDGRSVTGVDITPFISNLPGKLDTSSFSTQDASGSSSMAINIQESLELGCKLLLIDEDTSATNLLVRDERMTALIAADEPITPFVSRVRALAHQKDVSTVIVIGGCGDYLTVADKVISMRNWLPQDLTASARDVVKRFPAQINLFDDYGRVSSRVVHVPEDAMQKGPPAPKGLTFLETTESPRQIVANPAEGKTGIEMGGIEQLVETGQLRYVAEAMYATIGTRGTSSLNRVLDDIEEVVDKGGMDATNSKSRATGDMVRTRKFEIGAAINRLRSLTLTKAELW